MRRPSLAAVPNPEPAEHDDEFADLDDWMARIRPAGPPTDAQLLQLRMAIARHTDAAREILAELDRRRSP